VVNADGGPPLGVAWQFLGVQGPALATLQSPSFESLDGTSPLVGAQTTLGSDQLLAFDSPLSGFIARWPLGSSGVVLSKRPAPAPVLLDLVEQSDIYAFSVHGTEGWQQEYIVEPDGTVTAYRTEPDAHVVAFATDGATMFWSEASGAPYWSYNQPNITVWSAPYTNDPAQLAATARVLTTLPVSYTTPGSAIAFQSMYVTAPVPFNVAYIANADGGVQQVEAGPSWMFASLLLVSPTELWAVMSNVNGPSGVALARYTGFQQPLPIDAGAGGPVGDAGTDMSDADGGTGSSSSVAAPSCQAGGPGLSDCGQEQESCCASLEVAGGTYFRTYTLWPDGGTYDVGAPATVSGFKLDKYDVTVGRFRQFVYARNTGLGWTPPPGSGKHVHLNGGLGLANSGNPGAYEPGWVADDHFNVDPTTINLTCDPNYSTWTDAPSFNEHLPINCVNWYEVYAFCIWDGGFLPSEAEWEYAAAGGDQQREYPWGSTDPGTSNQYAILGDANGNCFFPTLGPCVTATSIAPVGTASLGAGRWGQLDLEGEITQLTLDWYAPFFACDDCAYLTPAYRGTAHGGTFSLSSFYSGPTNRFTPDRLERDSGGGLRCARSP
jgi:sulfatase modifying factor 1